LFSNTTIMKNLLQDLLMIIGYVAIGFAMFFCLWSIMLIING